MHPPVDPEHDRAMAFRVHIQPEIEVLLRVAGALTGNSAEAEDLVQETLIRAWRSVDRFDGAHPRAWLLTILRNTHKNMHRRQRPDLVENAAGLPGARPAFGVAHVCSPEEQLLDQTLPSHLQAAVNALPEPFRTTLLLIDVHGLSYADTAAALDVPLGTVMSRLSRARNRLRRHLRPRLDLEGPT